MSIISMEKYAAYLTALRIRVNETYFLNWSPPNDVFQFTIFFWKYFTDYEFECTLPCCLRES